MKKTSTKQLSLGISGAPGVGKTTVIEEAVRKVSRKYQVLLSRNVARSLAARGVHINIESRTDDYLAFLTVRLHDMLHLRSDLVIYERTLLDVLIFMKLNGDAHGWLKELADELVQWQMSRLSLYFYIPIEFEAEQDGVRIANPAVNRQIDKITVSLLKEYRPDFITLNGSVSERVKLVLESLSRLGLGLEPSSVTSNDGYEQ